MAHILIVEDEQSISDLILMNLAMVGHTGIQAFDSSEALEVVAGQLLELAWGYDYVGETRTVDMHIQRLRKKLDWDDVIKTVYKYGYRLEV